MDGVSLVDLMSGSRRSLDLEVFAESRYPERFGWSPLRALRDGRFKLIDAPRPELYDLERDPFEERNIFDERRPLAEAMMRRLEALDPGQRLARVSEEAVVPAALQENLAALGYVTPAPMRASRDGKDLPDPKDCVGLMGVNLRSADREIGSASIYDRVRCDSAIRVKSHMDRAIAKSEIADRR